MQIPICNSIDFLCNINCHTLEQSNSFVNMGERTRVVLKVLSSLTKRKSRKVAQSSIHSESKDKRRGGKILTFENIGYVSSSVNIALFIQHSQLCFKMTLKSMHYRWGNGAVMWQCLRSQIGKDTVGSWAWLNSKRAGGCVLPSGPHSYQKESVFLHVPSSLDMVKNNGCICVYNYVCKLYVCVQVHMNIHVPVIGARK